MKTPPYLGDDPVFAFGCGGLVHTLCPGRDVACTVIGITLEDQLTHTLAAGLEGTKSHAISQAVQHLSVNQRVRDKPAGHWKVPCVVKTLENRVKRSSIKRKRTSLTLDSPEGTSWPFAISNSFMSLTEQNLFNLSFIPQMS